MAEPVEPGRACVNMYMAFLKTVRQAHNLVDPHVRHGDLHVRAAMRTPLFRALALGDYYRLSSRSNQYLITSENHFSTRATPNMEI